VLQTEAALLMPVIAAALRRATSLATSVAARGFDPTARRKPYPPLKMSAIEVALTLILLSATGALLATKLLYWLYLAELYYRPGLRPLYDIARLWL
jgi:energy-coupling factor transporter transmembrane protein EcfT